MNRALLALPALSFLLLAAHELRTGQALTTAGWFVLALIILNVRRSWVRHVGITALALGLLIWTQATIELVRFRIFAEQPFTRLLVIMGAVIGLKVVSIGLLLSRPMQAWFAGKASPPKCKQE